MSFNTSIPVDTVPTPNPDAIMLKVQETLVPTGTHEFGLSDNTDDAPLARALLEIDGLELVLIAPRFVTLRKASISEWPDLIPLAKEAMRGFIQSGEMAVFDKSGDIDPAQRGEIEGRIITLLDDEIRPAVAMDGGDITFVSFENGVVLVQMSGACGSCPSATSTLKMGVERLLIEEIPEVTAVEQV